MGRSRGGLTTKIHALVDAEGRSMRLGLTPAQTHDGAMAAVFLLDLKPGAILLADRAYDSDAIRAEAKARSIWANIPPKRNRKTGRPRYPLADGCIGSATSSSASSTGSNSTAASPPATTNARSISSPPSNSFLP